MWALEGRVAGARPSLVVATPLATVGALGAALGACAALVALDRLPRAALGAVAVTAGHGTLLAAILAWTAWDDTPRWDPRPATAAVLATLAVAAAVAALGPHGGLAYLVLPAVYGVLVRRGRLASLGVRRPVPVGAVLLGGAVGATLGIHLLVSASLTLGYRLRADGPAAYAAALAYDAGVNVVSSEVFFRGALLRRALARWSLAGAVAATTGACLLRYLADPLLPHAAETVAGAVVYLTLLGVASGVLASRSGSVLPALAAAGGFFAAYRLVAVT